MIELEYENYNLQQVREPDQRANRPDDRPDALSGQPTQNWRQKTERENDVRNRSRIWLGSRRPTANSNARHLRLGQPVRSRAK